MNNISMVDLKSQYLKIKDQIDRGITEVIDSTRFIKGPVVQKFEESMAAYLSVKHVIACANGTDALQIALMALELKPGDEVIVPSFTYVATAEVIALLRLKPVMIDVDPKTFNVTTEIIEKSITPNTKAIVPVHLFGQNADMEGIMKLAKAHNIHVIEDNAQSIGSEYTYSDGSKKKSGGIADIGTTSFFPSKNLGCYGDGGAIFTNSDDLAEKIRIISNHGQSKQYYHTVIGVNSRLDAIQAAVLNVKLEKLDSYCEARQNLAAAYDSAFAEIEDIVTPFRQHNSTHVFHQYTMMIKNGKRDELRQYLKDRDIPSMIYYPVPLYEQEAFAEFYNGTKLEVTESLCKEVLSLPMHTEMDVETKDYIIENVLQFFA